MSIFDPAFCAGCEDGAGEETGLEGGGATGAGWDAAAMLTEALLSSSSN